MLPNAPYIKRKYMEFYEKHGYIPKFFVPYNCAELKDFCHTLTVSTGNASGCGSCLVVEEIESL